MTEQIKGGYIMDHKASSVVLNYINIVMLFTLADKMLSDRRNHLALFSLRTESDNPDATCELSP